MFTIFYTIIFSTIAIIWSIPFLLTPRWKFQLYEISTRSKITLVLNKLPKHSSIISDNGDMNGWIYGWFYCGYIHQYSTNHGTEEKIYLFCNTNFYKRIMDEKVDPNKRIITIWNRFGNYYWFKYAKRTMDVSSYLNTKKQQKIMIQIENHFKKNHHTVAYLYGPPNSGKSTIPFLLANKIKGSICLSFNPTEAGDQLEHLYNTVNPTEKNPLIIVFEEVDIMLERIHQESIKKHRDVPITVTNKTEYNTFMDWIDRGLYPHLILIMTSNKSPKEIDLLDSSYLREGRINLKIKVDSWK